MKRKKRHEEEAGEGWLLPYSDMLTLLLALFIVLFAMSKVDSKKFAEVQQEFGTILSAKAGSNSIENSALDSNSTTNSFIKDNVVKAKRLAAQRNAETQQLSSITRNLQSQIRRSALKNKVTIKLKQDGIHITMASSILFQTQSAKLTTPVKKALNQLGPYLKPLRNNTITIAGYTDNLPVANSQHYASNWDLSAQRAIAVMHFFIANKIIKEKNVTIEAFAANHPRANNQTQQGRAKNRRVEMVIQRHF